MNGSSPLPRRKAPDRPPAPRQVVFDVTPEIFATDSGGSFFLPLTFDGAVSVDTRLFDEVRVLVSAWYPSPRRSIDLDRAYVELRACLTSEEEHWMKLAEIEPVVPAYGGGDSFDGWIVLPIMAPTMSFGLFGSGFDTRARLQIRASAYFVA